MPKFKVKSPDGKTFEVNAPEGATKEDAIRYIQSQQRQPEQPKSNIANGELSAADVAQGAFKNFAGSAMQFGSDIYTAFSQPVKTAKTVYDLGKGVVQLAIPGEQGGEEIARQVGRFFKQRYGGLEAAKKTIANDPVGALADLSTVLSGGGTLAARTGALAGKLGKTKALVQAGQAGAGVGRAGQAVSQAGQAVANIGRAIDPLTLAGKGVAQAGRGAGRLTSGVLGLTTGASHTPFETAFKAGLPLKGSKAFRSAIKRTEDVDRVVAEAADAVGELAEARKSAYRSRLKDLQAVNPPIEFKSILDELKSQANSLTDLVTGEHSIIKGAAQKGKLKQLVHEIMEVAQDPRMHNALGLDHLKKVVQELEIPQKQGWGQVNRVRTAMANHIKQKIMDVVPEYEKMVGDYEQALRLENEIRGTFSLERHAKIDTTLRKLQSAMRDNVNTGYGRREKLLKQIDKAGKIQEKLAGQALHDPMPRGIMRGTLGAGMGVAAGLGHINPALAGLLLSESPRLMGGLAYGAGRVASPFKFASELIGPTAGRQIGRGLFQTGRFDRERDE